VQAIGVAATFTYTAVVTFILLKIVGMITGLRVSSDEETQGLDIIDHEERGYDL
jgi:Amt family ammonium transporter